MCSVGFEVYMVSVFLGECAFLCACVCVLVCACLGFWLCAYVCMCACVRASAFVRVYTCIYIHTHTHTFTCTHAIALEEGVSFLFRLLVCVWSLCLCTSAAFYSSPDPCWTHAYDECMSFLTIICCLLLVGAFFFRECSIPPTRSTAIMSFPYSGDRRWHTRRGQRAVSLVRDGYDCRVEMGLPK